MEHTGETLVVLGGTSAVAMAYGRIAAQKGEHIILVGRNKERLEVNAADLTARGAKKAECYICDLSDTSGLSAHWKKIRDKAQKIDRVLLAYGRLGDQSLAQNDVQALHVNLNTNFLSAAMWCEEVFASFQKAGQGQLTVIGSVAGDRGRQSNYHYGAAKGGLETFMNGMMHRAAKLKESEVNILLIKPGFIDTPMTDHLDKGGPLWASPEQVARIIVRAENRKKRVVYAPWFWRYILLIIGTIPFAIFKRSSL